MINFQEIGCHSNTTVIFLIQTNIYNFEFKMKMLYFKKYMKL